MKPIFFFCLFFGVSLSFWSPCKTKDSRFQAKQTINIYTGRKVEIDSITCLTDEQDTRVIFVSADNTESCEINFNRNFRKAANWSNNDLRNPYQQIKDCQYVNLIGGFNGYRPCRFFDEKSRNIELSIIYRNLLMINPNFKPTNIVDCGVKNDMIAFNYGMYDQFEYIEYPLKDLESEEFFAMLVKRGNKAFTKGSELDNYRK